MKFLKLHKADLPCDQAHMRIFAAYGSTKDISVYSSIGLPPSHIYIVGRPTKKMQSQCQVWQRNADHILGQRFTALQPIRESTVVMVMKMKAKKLSLS